MIFTKDEPTTDPSANLEIEEIVGHLRPNDNVITAGAGDIWKFSHKLLIYLKHNND